MISEPSGDLTARREERRETNWIALIRLPDGSEIPTSVKDVSPGGARLAVPSSYILPERFMFKVVGRDFVCAVKLAWRRGDYVGVHIERVGKLTALPVEQAAPLSRTMAPPAQPAVTPHVRRSRFSRI